MMTDPSVRPEIIRPMWVEPLFKLISNASILLIVLPAVFYFWGYLYYGAYTERVGMPFHGISLSANEVLVASWFGAFQVVIFASVALCSFQFLLWFIDWSAPKVGRWLRQKKWIAPKIGAQPDKVPAYFMAGSVLIFSCALVLGGGMRAMKQAQAEAERMLSSSPPVLIRDSAGALIPGNFRYLRDYGSALLVQEMKENQQTRLGLRRIKSANYSGFTILDPKPDDSLKK